MVAAPLTDSQSGLVTNVSRGLGSGGINAGVSPLYQVGTPRSMQLAAKVRF